MHRDNNAKKEADILDTQVWLCMTEVKWVSWIQIYLSYVNVNSSVEVAEPNFKIKSLLSKRGSQNISVLWEVPDSWEKKRWFREQMSHNLIKTFTAKAINKNTRKIINKYTSKSSQNLIVLNVKIALIFKKFKLFIRFKINNVGKKLHQ